MNSTAKIDDEFTYFNETFKIVEITPKHPLAVRRLPSGKWSHLRRSCHAYYLWKQKKSTSPFFKSQKQRGYFNG